MRKFILSIMLFLLLFVATAGTVSYADTDNLPPVTEPVVPDPDDSTAAASPLQNTFLPVAFTDALERAAALDGGFDRTMIPVEVQAWWSPAYGHVHTAVKLPFAGVISGVLMIPVRIVMHDNPGKLHLFAIATESTDHIIDVSMGDKTCGVSVCAWGFQVNLDTRKLKDGCRELRIKSYVNTPDGKQMITSSGIPVMVRNGGSSSDFNKSCVTGQLIGRGWYTGVDYNNGIIGNVPVAPVKGTYIFQVRAQNPSAELIVDLDKSHFIPAVPGWDEVGVQAGVNLLDKLCDCQKFIPLAVDTKTLANGWHSLQVRSIGQKGGVSTCPSCAAGMNFPSGVAKAWFFVQN